MIRPALLFALALATGVVAGVAAAQDIVSGDAIIVIDGDTVALPGGERIRLVEIDAPESFRSSCDAELVAGLAAKEALRALLAGRRVTIERNGLDRYRRTLARLITPAGDVGAALLRAGHALPYEPGRKAERDAFWCRGAR